MDKEIQIVPAQRKHLYTLNLLTKKYFPYANFTYAEITRRMADPNIVYLVAQKGTAGNTMGFVDYELKPDRQSAQILGLAVLEEHRMQGIGRRLLQEALTKIAGYRDLQGRPIRSVELLVSVQNHAAIALYGKFGFEKKGILDRTLYGQQVLVFAKGINGQDKPGQ